MSNTKKPYLAKPTSDLSIADVIHIIHDEQDRLECISDYGYDDLIPLTAQDIWKLMPWEEMKDAPLYEKIFVNNVDCLYQTAILNAEEQREWYERWLPLPKAG